MSIDELIPPPTKNFVGSGDFGEIGKEFLRYFIDLAGLGPGEKVLDVGCGIGRMAAPLTTFLNDDGSYEGFDIVEDGIKWCKEKITPKYPNFHFQLADVYNQNYNAEGTQRASDYQFPFASETFDLIFLTSVFTHMLPQDLEHYLGEVARVLKRKGRCLITYFLRNEQSTKLMIAKKSMLDFEHHYEDYGIQDLAMPESAGCYDEKFILGLYRKFGLAVKMPIHFGSWSGRSNFLSGQDIIVAAKANPATADVDISPGSTEHQKVSRKPKCSIIIPVYNHASLTRQCLNSILTHPPLDGDIEIVVVDDASTDSTPQLLRNYGEQIRVVSQATNSGFATGCNDAVAIASGEYLVFLNNDTIPESGWLDTLVRYAEGHPKAAVVGSKLLFPNGTIQHAGVVICQDLHPRHLYNGFPADHPAVNKSRAFQIVTAACALFRREPFEQVGGFDTAFRNSFEDVDICLRLGEKGYEIHYCHESVLCHLESVSRDSRGKQEIQNFQAYFSRWGYQVKPDDLAYYLEDGMLHVTYRELYPLQIEISPLLALVGGDESERLADRLLNVRAHTVYELLKENIQLRLRLDEATQKEASAH